MRRGARLYGLAMALAVDLASGPMVSARAADAAFGTTEQIGDWEFLCTPPVAPSTKPACRVVQNHSGANGGTVLLVTIVLQEASKIPVAVVSVPEGVYLAPGIELKVDDGQAFKLLYEACSASGCHAGYKMTGDIGAALKKGQIANHKLFDSKQKPVTIPVSLKGFSKALDRLQEAAR